VRELNDFERLFRHVKIWLQTSPGISRWRRVLRNSSAQGNDAPMGMAHAQADADRVKSFVSVLSVFVTDVCTCCATITCHEEFIGPRFLVLYAARRCHPLDEGDRLRDIRNQFGIGL